MSRPTKLKGRSSTGPTNTHAATSNWGGYINTGHTYSKVIAHWTQNSAGACNCTPPTAESTWVGLGGVNGGLIQDGTSLDNSGTSTPSAWWEYVGSNGGGVAEQDRGVVHVGDDVAASVSWNAAHTAATFGMTDNNRVVFNFTISLKKTFYDGSTADYINERPDFCSPPAYCYEPLTNFSTTRFSFARSFVSGSSSATSFTSLPYTAIVTTSDGDYHGPPCGSSSDLLMYPEHPSGQNFDTVWCRSGAPTTTTTTTPTTAPPTTSPPSASISASKGGPYGCGNCYSLNIAVHNFPTGTYTYYCHDNSGPGGRDTIFFQHAVSVTDPNQSSWPGVFCDDNAPYVAYLVMNGVASNPVQF